ncbi:MAG: class I SAM-dependent methyltransferase [Bacteroidales bacterium]|jgi:ubiquinone/menaquinone biosynthesis C-methylase UbiE|nr:class I SAM-dependent methyltransferase [Bacteroidales bacterium]MDD4528975.1 class I SAM-dependent methyltransferase [Bacteroidales bacterium]MDD4830110.1 class I SAM-dependent methyltransferase [Bacteroidales bacterium]
MIDNFQNKANTWDNPQKIRMTTKFSNELSESIFLYKEDNIAEVGAGTGLVGLSLVDKVNKIYMIDNSPSMLNVLREKLDSTNINKVEIVEGEFETTNLNHLDGVICYMSLHHIADTINFIREVKKRIKENGFFAIGDLIEEDGSFHGSKDILHFGFNLEKLSKLLEAEGFIILRETVYDYVSKNEKNYPIFIIIAQK